MFHDGFFAQWTHIFPYEIGAVFFHLRKDCLAEQISWLQLIGKTLSVLVVQKSTFASDGFGNQEATSWFMRIKCRRVNLYVIQMFKYYLMFHGNSKSVTCNMREVGGVFVKTSETTTCQNNVWCSDRIYFILLIHDDYPATDVVFGNDIDHGHIFADFNIVSCQCLIQKSLCDLFTGNIFIEKDSRLRMCSFSGEIQFSRLCSFKCNISL